MDDINVGDRRRFHGYENYTGEHEVIGVADFAVKIEYDNGATDIRARLHYEDNTEPVPAAPTFERGDVVLCGGGAYVIASIDSVGYGVRLGNRVNGTTFPATLDELAPTGHKVATVDESQWIGIRQDGSWSASMSRGTAEMVLSRYDTIVAIATVRGGRIVQPIIHEGVEHLVACNSEPRT